MQRHARIARIAAATICAGLSAVPALAQDWVDLRIVTLNTREGLIGPTSSALDATSDMITTVDQIPGDTNTGLLPDVVCFQELDASSRSDLTAYRDAYLPGFQIFSDPGGDGFNYNATLVAPGINVIESGTVFTGGPRRVVRVTLEVPGSPEVVRVYNAHFKAFGDSASQATRTNEANNLGGEVADDIMSGFAVGVPLENQHVIVAGDLNSNNNNDQTLDGLYFSNVVSNGCCAPEDGSADENFMLFFGVDCSGPGPCCVADASIGACLAAGGSFEFFASDTGLVDILYESLSAAQFAGFSQTVTFGSSSRLDYINANEDLALRFDENNDGVLEAGEVNAIGFVYRSEQNVVGVHAPGQFANGNASATGLASDHRPVVADFRFLPLEVPGPCCFGADTCLLLTADDCTNAGGTPIDAESCAVDTCTPQNLCTADLDASFTVDLDDFSIFIAQFGNGPAECASGCTADLDGNDFVNLDDFSIFIAQFGNGLGECTGPILLTP